MRKAVSLIFAIILCLGAVFMGDFLQAENNSGEDINLFRMHIRANSNVDVDQSVKYEIKEQFVEFLTPYIADCETVAQAKKVVNELSSSLKIIADDILIKNGFTYTSKIKICNEFFPDRYYKDFLVQSGYYDALICELGEAKGDNWWCVVYPPLCFVDCGAKSGVVYKSKILELIDRYMAKS